MNGKGGQVNTGVEWQSCRYPTEFTYLLLTAATQVRYFFNRMNENTGVQWQSKRYLTVFRSVDLSSATLLR